MFFIIHFHLSSIGLSREHDQKIPKNVNLSFFLSLPLSPALGLSLLLSLPPAVGCRMMWLSMCQWWPTFSWSCWVIWLCSWWCWFRSVTCGPTSPRAAAVDSCMICGVWPASPSCWASPGCWPSSPGGPPSCHCSTSSPCSTACKVRKRTMVVTSCDGPNQNLPDQSEPVKTLQKSSVSIKHFKHSDTAHLLYYMPYLQLPPLLLAALVKMSK